METKEYIPPHYGEALYHNSLYDYKVKDEDVIKCKNAHDVINALNQSRELGKGFTILGGGHNHEAFCVDPDKIVIDLSNIRTFEMVDENQAIWIGAGLTNFDVLKSLATQNTPQKKLVVTGECPQVGIGGFILGGGWSNQARQIGFAAQNVLEVEIVRHNGSEFVIETISGATLNQILSAGGGNFGVITKFKCKTFDYKDDIYNIFIEGTIPYLLKDKAAKFIDQWMKIVNNQFGQTQLLGFDATNITSNVRMYDHNGMLKVRISGRYFGVKNPSIIKKILDEILKPFVQEFDMKYDVEQYRPFDIPIFLKSDSVEQTLSFANKISYLGSPFFEELINNIDSESIYSCKDRRRHKVTSAFIRDEQNYTPTLTAAIEYLEDKGSINGIYSLITFHGIGGITHANQTSFGFKDKNFILQMQSWIDDSKNSDLDLMIDWPTQFRSYLDNKGLVEGAFINFIDRNLPLHYYYGSSYDKLRQFKKEFDPKNVFNFPMSIPPAE